MKITQALDATQISSFASVLLFYSRRICTIYGPTFPVTIFPKRVIKAFFPLVEAFLPDDRAEDAWLNLLDAFHDNLIKRQKFPEVSSQLKHLIDGIDVKALEKRLFEVACQRLDLNMLNWANELRYQDPLFDAFRSHFEYVKNRELSLLDEVAATFAIAEAERADKTKAKREFASCVGRLLGLSENPQSNRSELQGVIFKSQGLTHSNLPVWIVCVTSERPLETQLAGLSNTNQKFLVVVLMVGDKFAAQRPLKKLLRDHYFLAISDNEIVSSFFGLSNQCDLKSKIRKVLPVAVISPYRTSGDAGETFVGRTDEIERIITSTNSEFCIIGPRKIGKTSLLWELKSRINGGLDGDSVAVHVDSQSSRKVYQFQKNLYGEFVRQTKKIREFEHLEPGEDFFSGFSDRLSVLHEKGYRLTFLIDEIDGILAEEGVPLENFLRSAGNKNLARFIAFGYTTLSRRIKDRSSAIYNLFEQITLGPLDQVAAIELARKPMSELGITYEDDRVPQMIVEHCSQIPWLIQYICQKALESLHDTTEIKRRSIDEICNSQEFLNVLTSSIMDDKSLGTMQMLIIYIFLSLNKESCTESEIVDAVERHARHISSLDVVRSLRHLTETYVLRNTQSGGYRFFVEQQRRALSAVFRIEKIQALVMEITRSKELKGSNSKRPWF